jgi:hypothetical protein
MSKASSLCLLKSNSSRKERLFSLLRQLKTHSQFKINESGHLLDLGIDECIILNWIENKQCMRLS